MKNTPLEPNITYHIYNRGNNRENIFTEARNYTYFMALYEKYIAPIADTFAYCLLPNHFHFLIRIRQDLPGFENLEGLTSKPIYRHFSNFFNAYTKAFNKSYNRTGSLFGKNFKRKPVTNDRYFMALVVYIHQNPQRHGLINNFRDWPYSSYQALANHKPTKFMRNEMLNRFHDRDGFLEFHRNTTDFKPIESLIDDD